MCPKNGVAGPDVVAVAERGIKHAPFAIGANPCLRIIPADLDLGHPAQVAQLGVEAEKDGHSITREPDGNPVSEEDVHVFVGASRVPGGCPELIKLVLDRPTRSQHPRSRMGSILHLQYKDAILGQSPAKIGAEHLAELGRVIKSQRRIVHADETFPTPHELEDGLFLRIVEREIPVRHEHEPVELGEVLRSQKGEVEVVRVLQISLVRRDRESPFLAQRRHRLFRGPQARVPVETRVRQEKKPLRGRHLSGRRIDAAKSGREGNKGERQERRTA